MYVISRNESTKKNRTVYFQRTLRNELAIGFPFEVFFRKSVGRSERHGEKWKISLCTLTTEREKKERNVKSFLFRDGSATMIFTKFSLSDRSSLFPLYTSFFCFLFSCFSFYSFANHKLLSYISRLQQKCLSIVPSSQLFHIYSFLSSITTWAVEEQRKSERDRDSGGGESSSTNLKFVVRRWGIERKFSP